MIGRALDDLVICMMAAIAGLILVAVVIFSIFWKEIFGAVAAALVLGPLSAIITLFALKAYAKVSILLQSLIRNRGQFSGAVRRR